MQRFLSFISMSASDLSCCTLQMIVSLSRGSILHICSHCRSTRVASMRMSLHFWWVHLKRCSSSSLSWWDPGHHLLVQNPHLCIFFQLVQSMSHFCKTFPLSMHDVLQESAIAVMLISYCWVRLSQGSLPCFLVDASNSLILVSLLSDRVKSVFQ
jgi:hypothetical protein